MTGEAIAGFERPRASCAAEIVAGRRTCCELQGGRALGEVCRQLGLRGRDHGDANIKSAIDGPLPARSEGGVVSKYLLLSRLRQSAKLEYVDKRNGHQNRRRSPRRGLKGGVTKTTSQRFEILELVDRNDHPPGTCGGACRIPDCNVRPPPTHELRTETATPPAP